MRKQMHRNEIIELARDQFLSNLRFFLAKMVFLFFFFFLGKFRAHKHLEGKFRLFSIGISLVNLNLNSFHACSFSRREEKKE